MHVVFRTDGNSTTGIGHVMRCIALANALKEVGAHSTFLSRGEGLGKLSERITEHGHTLIPLPEGTAINDDSHIPHRHWLPHGWQHDVTLTQAALADLNTSPPPMLRQVLHERDSAETVRPEPVEGQLKPDWLVLDHYGLGADWCRAMRGHVGRIAVIDDLADRAHDCDLLVDQNPAINAADRYTGLVPAACQQLLGPRYGLLRSEFAAARERALARPIFGPARRVLVQYGGADPANLTGRTVDCIVRQGLEVALDVVVGPLNPHASSIAQQLSALPHATLHLNPNGVAPLMEAADLAIGSPGTTSWERCAMGLPTIVTVVADNQTIMTDILADQGAHLALGRVEQLTDDDLSAAIRTLALNEHARRHMRAQASALVDGQGANRIAKRMRGTAITLRRATEADAERLFAWRNDPQVRSQSFDPRPLIWEEHRAWFANTLGRTDRALLVAEVSGSPAGCLRFDLHAQLHEKEARISIYLDPQRLGEGLAIPVLQAGEDWLASHHPEIHQITAEVRAGNEASRRSFLGAGYAADHLVLTRTLREA